MQSKMKAVMIGVVMVIVFGMLYVGILRLYQAEDESIETKFSADEAQKPGYVEIDAKLLSVDPIKGDLAIRLQFTPSGNLSDDDGISPNKNLVLELNSSTGKTEINFKKGERMNPLDAVVDVDGAIGDYPFDSHEATLVVQFLAVTGDKDNLDYEDVPFTINYTGAIAGYAIEAKEAHKETGYTEINMTVARSTTATTFAVFIMVLEWLLSLSALAVAVTWILGRKIEVTMFGWMGALLFAMIPLRNAMPGAPPVGVYSDFLAFFWAEFIVALSLVASVLTWILRPVTPAK
jgi:hypothetical protein